MTDRPAPGGATREELEQSWRDRACGACREWEPQVGHFRLEGVCVRCGRNAWAHAWRLAADELSDYFVRAGDAPRVPQDAECAECGAPLKAGEAKCFTVCDACWDTALFLPAEPERPKG